MLKDELRDRLNFLPRLGYCLSESGSDSFVTLLYHSEKLTFRFIIEENAPKIDFLLIFNTPQNALNHSRFISVDAEALLGNIGLNRLAEGYICARDRAAAAKGRRRETLYDELCTYCAECVKELLPFAAAVTSSARMCVRVF